MSKNKSHKPFSEVARKKAAAEEERKREEARLAAEEEERKRKEEAAQAALLLKQKEEEEALKEKTALGNPDPRHCEVASVYGISTGKLLSDVLTDLVNSKSSRYTDPEFQPNEAAVNSPDIGRLEFKRYHEFDSKGANKTTKKGLPTEGCSPDHIKQGQLGDCYLLSAIATVAEKPELISDMFAEGCPEKSVYAIRWYFNGAFVITIVDDYLPMKKNYSNPVFSHGEVCNVNFNHKFI